MLLSRPGPLLPQGRSLLPLQTGWAAALGGRGDPGSARSDLAGAGGLGKPLRCAQAIELHPAVGFLAASSSSPASHPVPLPIRAWTPLPVPTSIRTTGALGPGCLSPTSSEPVSRRKWLMTAKGGWGRIWVSKSKVKLWDKGSCGCLSKQTLDE